MKKLKLKPGKFYLFREFHGEYHLVNLMVKLNGNEYSTWPMSIIKPCHLRGTFDELKARILLVAKTNNDF